MVKASLLSPPIIFSAKPFWKRQLPVWRGKVSYHLAVRWVMLGCALHFALHSNPAFANPTGAQVVAGGAQIENAGSVVNITQSTDRAVINWQGFSIAGHEVTNFIQPNASSAVLNRVTSGEASQIMGALNANGQVYLINPAGVMIGNGAVINVGSFIATTANVGDEAFMNGGAMNFVGATDAAIRNEGTINAHSGDVLLFAKTVENKGMIQAGKGTAALLAGKDFYLKKDQAGAVKVKVAAPAEGSATGVGVANSGTIEAMQAQLEAQGNVYALAINQAGIIRATGVSRDASGVVVLSAPNGTIRQTGTMLALNRDGSGGRLSISGRDIAVEASSIMTAAGSGVTALAMGGQIEISAEKDAILDGRLDVSAGDGARGGRLVVTGERVGLFGGKVDASGGTGGGEVLLGGDYQGLNPLVRNASRTYVGPEAEIRADATLAGDGGKIITWSDNGTQFYGSASAQGGSVRGDGGLVEVSGRDFLDYAGSVNTLAPNGQTGMLLLDPTDLTISNSADTPGFTGPAFVTPASATAVNLSWATIAASLVSSAVTISTASASAQTGNISITGAATGVNALNSNNNLTITAVNNANILVSAGVTNTGTGELILNTSGTGTVTVNAAVTLAGNFTANSASTVTINSPISGAVITLASSAAGIAIGSNGDITATGLVSINGSTGISTAGNVSTTGTAVTYTGAVTLTGDITIETANGNLTFSSTVTGQTVGNQSLTVTAGNGNIIMTGAVGGTSLKALTVNSAGNFNNVSTVRADNDITIFADSLTLGNTITSLAGNVQVGPSTLTKSIGLNVSNGDLLLPDLSKLAATTGTVTLGRDTMVGTISVGAAPTIGGKNVKFLTSDSGQTILNGSVTLATANKTLTFDSPTVLATTGGTTTITTDSGAITFTKGVTADGISTGNLTLNVGSTTAANLTMSGTVGTTRLGAITISKAAVVTINGSINAVSLTAAGGAAITTANFNNSQDYNGTAGVSFVADTINLSGPVTATDGTNTVPVVFTADGTTGTGTLTISSEGDITSNGAVTLTSSGGTAQGIKTAGNITTTGNTPSTTTITLSGGPAGTDLTGSVTLTTANSNMVLGTLNSSAAASLTVVAGTGNVTIGNASGSLNPLGSVSVNSAATLGVGSLISSSTVTLTGTALTVNTLTAGGNVSLGRSGGTISSSGNITTTSGTISFLAPTTLSADINLNTSAGNGAITFQSTLAGGGKSLNINSGSGLVSFNGALSAMGDAVGAAINISSTGLVTFASTVGGANGIVSSNVAGSTRFNDNVTLTNGDTASSFAGTVTFDGLTWSGFGGLTAGAVTLSTGAVSLNSNGGNIQFASIAGGSQNLTLAAGIGAGTVTVTGNVTALGSGTGAALTVTAGQTGLVDFQGTFAGNSGISAGPATNLKFGSSVNLAAGSTATPTTLGSVTFAGTSWSNFNGLTAGAVTLSSGPVSLNSNNGNIQFSSIAGGGQNLTLAAGIGTGTVTVTGNVTALGTGTGAALTVAAGQTGVVNFQGTFGGNSGITAGSGTSLTFQDNVTLAAGNTGTTFAGNVTLDGLTFQAGRAVTFGDASSDQLTLSGNAVSIATTANNGNLTFNAKVDGAQDLTLGTNGTGTITFAAAVGSGTALGDGTGAAMIINSGVTEFQGTVQTASGLTVTPNVTFRDNVTLAAGNTDTTFAGNVTLDGLTFQAGRAVTFGDAAADQVTLSSGPVAVNTSNADIFFSGPISGVGIDLSLSAGSGTVTLANTATVRDLTIFGDEIDINNTITATGPVLLGGGSAGTTIGVGGGTGALDLTDAELARITAPSITIGRADQTGNIEVDDITFQVPVTIRSSGGTVLIDAAQTITATGATTSVTLQGATLTLNGGINTAGGAVTLTGGTGGVALAAGQDIDTAADADSSTSSGVVSISTTGAGTINLAGNIVTTGAQNNGAAGNAGGAVDITSVNGTVTISGNITSVGGQGTTGVGGSGGAITVSTSTGTGNIAISGALTTTGGQGAVGVGGNGGAIQITTANGTISLANLTTSGGQGNTSGGNAGAITINSTGGNTVSLNSTISAIGGTPGTGSQGNGANITFQNPVLLTGGTTINNTGSASRDIKFESTLKGAQTLGLTAGTGNVYFQGAVGVGVGNALTSVTISSAANVTASLAFNAGTLNLPVLANTGSRGLASFLGNLSLNTLNTASGAYDVAITGGGTIVTATTFQNTGTLSIGSGGATPTTTTFTGGLVATAQTGLVDGVTLRGTIVTTGLGTMTLGDNNTGVTLGANTELNSGTGAIGVNGALAGGGFDLELQGGAGTGTVTIAGAISNLGSLTTTGNAYDVLITGGGTIGGATTFQNTGKVTIGSGGATPTTTTFTGGLVATAQTGLVDGVTLLGTIATTGLGTMTLGDNNTGVTLGANTVLNSGTGAIGVNGALAGGGFDLKLQGGAGTGTVTIAGAISNLGSLTTTGNAYDVLITGGGTIGGATTFQNTGKVTIGLGGATPTTTTFTGGLNTTPVLGTVTLRGTILSVNTPQVYGAVTLDSSVVTLNTQATTAAGDITLGAVTGGGNDLNLSTGARIAGADVTGTSVSNVGTLGLSNIGGTATFSGAVSATTLNVAGTVVNFSSTGTGGTVGTATFANSGNLTLGQVGGGGTQTYTGGLSTSAVLGTVTLRGTILSVNTPQVYGAVTLGSPVVTLNTQATTGAGDITLGAVTGGGNDLNLSTGAGIAGADVTGTSVSGVGTLGLSNIGGTATFSDAVSATTLNVAGTVVNFSSTGTGGTVGTATFANSRNLTLGKAGGTQTYTGGVDTTVVGGTVTLNGTIRSANTPQVYGAVSFANDTTLDSGTGAITLGNATIANGFTLTVGAGGLSTINMGTVSGVAGGSASNLEINTTGTATVGVIGTDMGSVSATANTLTLSDITTSGGMTFTVDTLVSPGTLTSTGGGDITIRPVTAGRAMGVGAGVVSGGLDLGTILVNVFTSGRVTLGSVTSGAITIGTQNLSANSYSGFSLLSNTGGLTFNSGATLTLPSATDIRVSIGNGNVVGSSTVNNLVATAGTVRFAAGSVTIGTQVANLEASTTTSNGFVLVNSQGLNVLGAQRAGSSFLSAVNTKDYLVQTTAGDLNLSSGTTFTAQDVTLAAAGNFYNQAGSAPFTNQNGGRTLVFSSQPVDNQPPTATGGFSGFGTVYLATPNITIGTLGGYTVNNSLPSGNLMVFSGPPAFPLIEPGTSTYNDLVNTAVYQATVPILGYSLPGIYTGQVSIGFKSASAPVQNSIGGPSPVKPSPVADQPGRMRVGKTPGNPVNDPMAENKLPPPAAGRLRVSQLVKPQPQVGSSESPVTKPAVRVGNVSLRMSGEFYPFELAEVTISGAKVSQNR